MADETGREAEKAVEDAVAVISATAEDVIEDHNARVETSEKINEILVDAHEQAIEEQRRQEHERRLQERFDANERAHAQLREEFATCQARLMDLETKTLAMEASTSTETMAQLIQAQLNRPSGGEDGPRENQEQEPPVQELVDEVPPEIPEVPLHPAERALKKRTRLL